MYPLGFAIFYDIRPGDMPPRKEPAYPDRPDLTWTVTVRDEAEWLVRPDLWGLENLPESTRHRKRNLAAYYSFEWYRQAFLRCEVCSDLLQLIISESGWHPERLTNEAVVRECGCGHASIHRNCRNRLRGLITETELHVSFGNALADRMHIVQRDLLAASERDYVEFRQRAAQYGRWLAPELIGPNPFRPISLPDEWRTTTAVSIAKGMFDSRDFAAMPLLADALEDAGCTHPDILDHCRGSGPHVRGCWVVDLVLGKS